MCRGYVVNEIGKSIFLCKYLLFSTYIFAESLR